MPVRKTKAVAVSVAEAKKSLSELLGRVAYGQETITIQKRGKPMARLVPVPRRPVGHLADVKGWLWDDDALFNYIEEMVRNRQRPRAGSPLKG
jgi:prevent-host-death family protein